MFTFNKVVVTSYLGVVVSIEVNGNEMKDTNSGIRLLAQRQAEGKATLFHEMPDGNGNQVEIWMVAK